jgi:TonB family protein
VTQPLPAPPPQSVNRSLLADRSRVGLRGALALAICLHIAVFAVAFALPILFPASQQVRKPIIARMVALGKPRDQRLLPRKENPFPTAGASKVAPPAPAVASSSPPPGKAPSRPAPRAPTRAEMMARALAGVRADAPSQAREPDPERAGASDGSAIGTAATAEAGEKYFGEVHDIIQQNYVVPSVISERERMALGATIVVWIAADGRLLRHRMEKPSGNAFFDRALETAIARSKLPPPPPELARELALGGVGINFRP